jgi:copper oxidase (laccase) domain-containing protein
VLGNHESIPYKEISPGQYKLNLSLVNKMILLNAGIREMNIKSSSYCTSCEEDLFFSHRRDQGKTGRMMSFIGYRED